MNSIIKKEIKKVKAQLSSLTDKECKLLAEITAEFDQFMVFLNNYAENGADPLDVELQKKAFTGIAQARTIAVNESIHVERTALLRRLEGLWGLPEKIKEALEYNGLSKLSNDTLAEYVELRIQQINLDVETRAIFHTETLNVDRFAPKTSEWSYLRHQLNMRRNKLYEQNAKPLFAKMLEVSEMANDFLERHREKLELTQAVAV